MLFYLMSVSAKKNAVNTEIILLMSLEPHGNTLYFILTQIFNVD